MDYMTKRNKTISSPLLLGAHLSVAGGYHHALLAAEKLKCNCLQIFLKNQRQWSAPELDPAIVEEWKATRTRLGSKILHVVGHSGYLINLAGDDPLNRERSFHSLEEELRRCEILGIDRLVLHPGSHRGQGTREGLRLVTEALDQLLSKYSKTIILLENTAGAGNCLGGKIEDLSCLIEKSRYPERMGCCLDTCHLFASGYEINLKSRYDNTLRDIDRMIGIEKIGCFHLNDSVGPLGSHLDRHEHIGLGNIGLEAFRFILTDPRLEKIPKIIETPKGIGTDGGLDRKNLNRLRKLVDISGIKF
jgi:deoxyribonuclease IV